MRVLVVIIVLLFISGIPTLVIWDKEKGEVITTKGRSVVSGDPEGLVSSLATLMSLYTACVHSMCVCVGIVLQIYI